MRTILILLIPLLLCSCAGVNTVDKDNRTEKPIVVRAEQKDLNWLQENQNADGSWGSPKNEDLTAMCFLAYLERGYTPLSDLYGETVRKAAIYLESHASSSPWRVIALSRFYSSSRHDQAKTEVQQAVRQIINQQGLDGSFPPPEESILKLTKPNAYSHCLTIYALLQSYRYCRLDTSQVGPSLQKAFTILEQKYQLEDGVRYRLFPEDTQPSPLATSLAALVMHEAGKLPAEKQKSARHWLAKNVPLEWDTKELKYPVMTWLFAHYALYECMGSRCDTWRYWDRKRNRLWKDKDSPNGTWSVPTSKVFKSELNRRCYTTAMVSLALSVYFAYRPTFSVHIDGLNETEAEEAPDLGLTIE